MTFVKLEIPCLALALVLAACIENEERISVRRDGALTVVMTSKGDAEDLASGYPLALGAPWVAADAGTREWIARIGADTGSAAAARGLAAWTDRPEGELRLSAGAHFASAAELPRHLAPPDEVYRTAFLERGTRLGIESRGGRSVYTFERTYGARRWADRAVLAGLEGRFSAEVQRRLEHSEPLTDEHWSEIAPIVVEGYVRSGLSFAREALVSIYVDGDASLPTEVLGSALDAVAAEVRARIDEARLRRLYQALVERGDGEVMADAELNPDLALREALRSSLRASLAPGPEPTRNAVLERLEHAFTAFDATGDLQDESFRVAVEMPGTIVDGNYDELDGPAAVWEFEGKALDDRALVLRVVSVVE
jgi:hypothetical protein